MRQLLPDPCAPVDPLTTHLAEPRDTPTARPWVMLNMVASVDGAIAVDGVSGGLGGEGDRAVFRAIRASCDWILVAAGTVRAERYRIPRTDDDVATRRAAHGFAAPPRLAVVTASVDLDPGLPLFAEHQPGDARPLVITGAEPPADRVTAIGARADWLHLPTARPDAAAVVAALGTLGARVVLAEGGPSFNGQLVDAELVDELNVTISPHLVGGESPRLVDRSRVARPRDLRLVRLLEHDGALFARYVRP